MARAFVDVPKLIKDALTDALPGVGVYRDPPRDVAERTPFLVYSVTAPVKVSNAAFRHGVKFTLVLNLVTRNYKDVSELADRVTEKTLGLSRFSSPVGKISHIEITNAAEDARTALSATELEQMTITFEGIARKE